MSVSVWLTVCLFTICAHLAARRDIANTISHHQLWHKHSHKNKYAKLFSLACTRCGRQSGVSSYTALWLHFFCFFFSYSTNSPFQHVPDSVYSLKQWLSFSICYPLQSALMCSLLFFAVSQHIMMPDVYLKNRKKLNKQIYDSFMQKMQFKWCFACYLNEAFVRYVDLCISHI